ncbi:hypothetical protein EMA8858_03199 [Emticicia aquatica]|uniref:Methyltransferase FkbM domain-containing protein n=1 Tax=Emticicia aquatica TaxID=1681835 RepID=A0ABM9ASW8_9BACT|nr:hypothetical protein [Emticicia aquatica]CAH0997062.1 hypothetical protein EMA8858_03199 [Emticicia aquatica]
MKKSNILSQYAKNVVSQNGEDGIIERILEILPNTNNWCVEFGAWDGKYLSNCYNLISNLGWNGVMIEGNSNKYRQLQQTYKGNEKTYLFNRFVNFTGKNSLDNILQSTPIPIDFDILSIDIDGNDYHIWDSLKIFMPKVVIIEFNPTIPSDIAFVQERNIDVSHGSSLLSLNILGISKGYELIGTTLCNAIFVKKEYFSLFGIENNSPSILWDTEGEAPRVFQLFDGTIVLSKGFNLIWKNVKVDTYDLQKIPKYFRFNHDYQNIYGLFKAILFKVIKKIVYNFK